MKMEWNVDGGYGTGRGGEKKGSRRIEGRKGVREPRSIKGCQPGKKKKVEFGLVEMEWNVDGGGWMWDRDREREGLEMGIAE